MPRSPRERRGSRSSWFVDHVRGSVSKAAAGAAAALKPEGDRPELARSVSPDQFSAASSVPNVDVVIPPDVREGLGAALANRQGTRREPGMSDEEMHHNDIVEHLDVIDAQISTVSYLSNAANSIIIPPLSWYSRKPVVSLPASTRARERDAESMESENELDAHVEEVLSKRAWLRRSLQGLWAYLKTPIGFVAAIYGFLVVFWGAAIVFFLGKLINLHDPYLQGFWVEISSQVVNGLFTVQGVGFLPWRIMDSWNTFWIYHYARKDRTLRMRANLPPVGDFNDIPDPLIDSDHVQMLTDKQLQWLRRHQVRLLKSQTWYRPHATDTHRAFSLKFAIAICISVDLNSVFQILLCGCMWGLNRFQRPAWTVATLIPLSFLCGIASGILIWKGGERSKKTAEVRERLQQALEQEKKVLRERYGSTIAEEPTLLRAPPSGDPEKDVNGRGSSESARKKSPLLKTLAIDETMTIPEDVEPTTTSSSKEKRPFKEEKDDSKIILVTPKSPSIKDFGDGKAE
ncbi:hypothetical protein CPB86DRAFT_709048 [Serendipita vermifera]|nr:hypothetical protein CPB86DRAFT_709048 [Serendipita vermifera]